MSTTKKNPSHLTNKSLIMLGEFTKLSQSGAVKNFVTTLAPKWPEGREILYSLLKSSDKWMRVMFTYAPLRKINGTRYFEIRLSVLLYPDRMDNFYSIVESWPKCLPSSKIPDNIRFRKHSPVTQKIFKIKNSQEHLNTNYETLVYSKYFYSKKVTVRRMPTFN